MPNHCEQDLYISGPKDEVERLITLVAEGDAAFSANKIIPYPEHLAVLDAAARAAKDAGVPWDKIPKDGFNQGGYEWCQKHWGSKWGAYDATLKRTTRGVTYTFKSAWAPITPVIEALSRSFPKLHFKLDYFESGMAFQGSVEYRAGKVRDRREGNYHGERGG